MAKIFFKFHENINLEIQKAQWNPNKINTKKDTPKHIRGKWLKTKNKEENIENRGKWHTACRIMDSDDCGFPIWSYEGQQRVEQYL